MLILSHGNAFSSSDCSEYSSVVGAFKKLLIFESRLLNSKLCNAKKAEFIYSSHDGHSRLFCSVVDVVTAGLLIAVLFGSGPRHQMSKFLRSSYQVS